MMLHPSPRNEEKNEFICSTHKEIRRIRSVPVYTQRHPHFRYYGNREDVIQTVSRYAITDEDGFRRTLAKQAQQSQPDLQKQIIRRIRAREKANC